MIAAVGWKERHLAVFIQFFSEYRREIGAFDAVEIMGGQSEF